MHDNNVAEEKTGSTSMKLFNNLMNLVISKSIIFKLMNCCFDKLNTDEKYPVKIVKEK